MDLGFSYFILLKYQDPKMFYISKLYFKKYTQPSTGFIVTPLGHTVFRNGAKKLRIQWLRNHINTLKKHHSLINN